MWQSEMCVARLARLFLAFAFFQIALVWPNAVLLHSADFVQSVGGVWTSHEPLNLTQHWLDRLCYEISFVTQGKVFVGRHSLVFPVTLAVWEKIVRILLHSIIHASDEQQDDQTGEFGILSRHLMFRCFEG